MTANQKLSGQKWQDESAIQAVIFDIDDVLNYSELIYLEIERSSYAHFGQPYR
ncbi:hypothetical protein [Paenibacillus agri]|uniref:hypothetical protein n=1 Tax=Paenibacillus agri TaxID=2744309 RepID=UPI001FE9ED9F|nr:hypothetical protein [Paenibacillus agri]